MFGPIRAVAIDDDPSHLLSITAGLAAIGIPCLGYWYDREVNELRPSPTEGGLPFLRLIFMDLNLAEQAGIPEAGTLAAGVMDVLKQIVSRNSGPYLLVFWTQVGTRVAEVEKIIYERLEDIENIPCPIAVIELSKNPFIITNAKAQDFKSSLREFYSELHKSIKDLGKAVEDAVTGDPQLSALSFWESRASDAAASAVNQIHSCSRSDQPDPSKATASIRNILAKIAIAASGETSAMEDPARALDAGMIDILEDQFGNSLGEAAYKEAVDRAIGPALKGKVEFQNEIQMAAVLNTFFHIDKEVGSANMGDRGVVFSAKTYNKNHLGFRLCDQLTDFLIPYEVFDPGRREAMEGLWIEIRNSHEFVLIELGADCEHAQNPARTRRYLLGLEVPLKFSDLIRFPGNKKLRSESLQLLGPWIISGTEPVFLLVSCRRFCTWQDKNIPVLSKIKYRLRAPLVDKLLHHYSAFHSRPGIIEFQMKWPEEAGFAKAKDANAGS